MKDLKAPKKSTLGSERKAFLTFKQVTAMTWNTDALFDKLDPEDHETIEVLAGLLGQQLYELDAETAPEVVVLHLQEVTSCASATNSIKMAFTKTSFFISSPKSADCGKSALCLNLQSFGVQLGIVLGKFYKSSFSCHDILFFQAIGTIVCKRDDFRAIQIDQVLTTHFGESSDKGHLGLKVGFKGGLVIRIRAVDDQVSPDLIFVNVHASSKAIGDRRRHFLTIVSQALDAEYGVRDKIDGKSALFFFAGDFNARTGTNLEGVTDKTWAKPVNVLGERVRECNLALTPFVIQTGNLGQGFQLLPSAGHLPVDGLVCQQVFELMHYYDEYGTWLDKKPDILSLLFNLQIHSDSQDIVYSPIQEAPKNFLPSYCLQKGEVQSYGHLHKGGLVHYTDRIFFATRQSLQEQVSKGEIWTITPVKYSGHVLNFLSDHAAVFGTYKIGSVAQTPDWLTNNHPSANGFQNRYKNNENMDQLIERLTELEPSSQATINGISEAIKGGVDKVRFVRRPVRNQIPNTQVVQPNTLLSPVVDTTLNNNPQPELFDTLLKEMHDYDPSLDKEVDEETSQPLVLDHGRPRTSSILMVQGTGDNVGDSEVVGERDQAREGLEINIITNKKGPVVETHGSDNLKEKFLRRSLTALNKVI